jgi:hypothetical protein
MASSKRSGILLREHQPSKARAKATARDSASAAIRSARRLSDVMPGATGRTRARKMRRSYREEPAGWGTALVGIAASLAGAAMGIAAARRRQRRQMA